MFSLIECRIRFTRNKNSPSEGQRIRKRQFVSQRVLAFDTLESRRLLAGDLAGSELLPPTDQLPTDLNAAFISGIPENETTILLGTLDIVDADGGPSYIDFGANSEFLELTGNELRYSSSGPFNFEQTPTFTFDVKVYGGEANTLAVTKSFTFEILDRNDAPLGINFEGSLAVQEFVNGFQFGTIDVSDEDTGETYNYVINDPRFEVAGGKLQLKPDASLRYATDAGLSIEVVATGSLSGDVVTERFSVGVSLAPPPWQNKNWALDVNNDGSVTTLDALLVINFINQMGIGPVDTPPPAGSETFIDVNGDRFVTPLDVLIIINFLNQVNGPTQVPTSEGEESGQNIADSGNSVPAPIQPSPSPEGESGLQPDSSDIQKLRRRLITV